MAYHNGDGWVSIHHPDDSFHSNELCRHCFANMACRGCRERYKRRFCLWTEDGAGLGFPAGALRALCGGALQEILSPPRAGMGSHTRSEWSQRKMFTASAQWLSSSSEGLCAPKVRCLGSLDGEGGSFHGKGCFYWLLGGQRHIKP